MKRRNFLKGLMGAGAIPIVESRAFFANQQWDKVKQKDSPVGGYRIVPISFSLFNEDTNPFVGKYFDSVKSAMTALHRYVMIGAAKNLDEWEKDQIVSFTPCLFKIVEPDIGIVTYKMKCGSNVSTNIDQRFKIEYVEDIHQP